MQRAGQTLPCQASSRPSCLPTRPSLNRRCNTRTLSSPRPTNIRSRLDNGSSPISAVPSRSAIRPSPSTPRPSDQAFPPRLSQQALQLPPHRRPSPVTVRHSQHLPAFGAIFTQGGRMPFGRENQEAARQRGLGIKVHIGVDAQTSVMHTIAREQRSVGGETQGIGKDECGAPFLVSEAVFWRS